LFLNGYDFSYLLESHSFAMNIEEDYNWQEDVEYGCHEWSVRSELPRQGRRLQTGG
jgi:hypothetical protein